MWEFFMRVTYAYLKNGPDTFSAEAWDFIQTTLFPWFLGFGMMLINAFILIAFCRQASNLRDKWTLETWIGLLIKAVISNVLMLNIMPIMKRIINLATQMTANVAGNAIPWQNVDASGSQVGWYIVFGLIYWIAQIICGVIILVEVMMRFVNLFILTAVSPIALSTLAGGRGLENTAYAWIKSFLAVVFQLVMIAVILRICGMMLYGVETSVVLNNPELVGAFNGGDKMTATFAIMVLMATAVKGSDALIRRAFALT